MTEEHKPKVPLFSKVTVSGPANGAAKNRGKRRLSVSLLLLVGSAVVGGTTILWTGFISESEVIEISRKQSAERQLIAAYRC